MKEAILNLKSLQDIDDGIHACEDQIAKLRARLEASDRDHQRLQESVKSQSENSKALKVALKAKEGELAGVEAEIQKLQTQLNQAKSNKEFTALKHQIGTTRERASAIEDEILKMLEQIEGGDSKLKELNDSAGAREAEVKARRAEIQERLASLEAHHAELKQRRKEAAAKVDAARLAVYERIHRNKPDGKALAPARNFTCAGCQMTLPPNVVNLLMRGEEMQTCRHCSRILYLDDK
ncbi:MAG TPA: C4-type zinc ribbon domain-containing protein [Candidatus Brocadiia bacterium]|nr:C4-type zinc ribbon domain-containing protein [Candidatus Brocadiia bacterium]